MPSRTTNLVFTLLLMVGGLVGLAVGFVFYRQDTQLAAHGVHVNATVIAALVHRSRSSVSDHRQSQSQVSWSLDVEFPLVHGTQRADLPCTYMAYLTHKAGETVEVIYDPADSSRMQLGGNLNDRSNWLIMILSGAAFLLGLTLMIFLRLNRDSGPDPTDPYEQ